MCVHRMCVFTCEIYISTSEAQVKRVKRRIVWLQLEVCCLFWLTIAVSCYGLQGHLDRTEPLLLSSVTPVLFLSTAEKSFKTNIVVENKRKTRYVTVTIV